MSLSIDSDSLEYIRVPFFHPLRNGVPYDVTGDVVDFAVIPQAQTKPAGIDWATGDWENPNGSGTYFSRLLVGPTSTVGSFAAGDYSVWVRLHDSPEIPIRLSGYVTFY